jgi:hypothetical protein
MKQLKNHSKVLATLSLAASDTREDTLESIISNTLFEKGKIKLSSLGGNIQEIYEFEPHLSEINSLVERMIRSGKIISNDEFIELHDTEKERLDSLEIQIRDNDKERFQNFKHFILEELKESLSITEIKRLWSLFSEYLYLSFFEYGVQAIKRLRPDVINGTNGSDTDCFLKICQKISVPNHVQVFKKVVDRFADYATQKDIDFINELAQKTLSFSSLGYEPGIADPGIQHNLIDWTLFLDTNVLYSILNLHSHPENEASRALVGLINKNKSFLNIKLRYSELTAKELSSKKAEFSQLDDKLSDSTIRALLRTDNIDDFTRQFYESLLNHRESTLHPSEVIDLSNRTLKLESIDISRNGARLEQIGEQYLNLKTQDYLDFITRKNEIKEEFCLEKEIKFHPIYKSDHQAYHDITLRELLLHLRTTKVKSTDLSLNSVKYFAITLDDLLINFDRSQIANKVEEQSFPVFFKPSYLLNKLVKILPLKTQDYQKAFIKAVTSRGFNKDIQKTHDVLKIVNYLKSKGIVDENVIYNIISDDLILEKYRRNTANPQFNSEEFFESELNALFLKKEKDLQNALEELKGARDKVQEKEESLSEKENTLLTFKQQKEGLEKDLKLYKSALDQLNKDVEKLKNQQNDPSAQPTLNFESAEKSKELDLLRNKMKNVVLDNIENYKDGAIKKWQRSTWWHLFWAVPLSVGLILFYSIPNLINPEMGFIKPISALFTLIFDGFFVFIIRARYFDEKNKEARRNNIRIPAKFQKELDELNKEIKSN